jgi:hypothetical protein
MNLGQALAMMQYANQAKDYTNRYKATPTLDWADIASAPVDEYGAMQPPVGQMVPPQFGGYPPIGEAIAGYTPPPVPDMAMAGYAPPQPPIEQRGVPAFMADQTFGELYGAPAQEPPSRITPMAFTPSPTEPTGVYGAMPSFAPPTTRMAMAPLPIPGRPVGPMTDVPTSEMIEPGRSVALAQGGEGEAGQMLRPNTPSQFKPFRVEVPAVPKTPFDNIQPQQVQQPVVEEKPKYEPGQPFPVTLAVGDKTMTGTVESFTPPAANARPRAIRFIPMNAEGKAGAPINIPASNQELYRQVDEQYRSLIGSTSPAATEDETYKSQIKIGDQWVKARVDEDTGEVFYPIDPNKPEFGEAKFGDSIKDIIPGDNYKGPINQYGQEDLTQISNARKRVSEFMEPMIRTLSSTATGYEGGLTAEELSRNITPKFIPGDENNPLGEIQWMVRDPRTNEELTLEEAADILPAGIAQKLQDSFNQLKQMSDETAAGAMAAQSAQAPSMRQSVMDTMDQQLAQLQRELAAATTAAESTRIQKLIDQKQRDRLNFMASSAAGITGPGGATVFEAPQAEAGYTLNPNTLTGRLQLISGVNPVPGQYQQGSANAVWTMEGLAEKIKQDALQNVRSNAITVSPEYNSAVRTLSGIMRRIQSDAFEQFGEDASNILNQDATFYYYDREDGRIATVVMPYKQAVDNFNSYSQAYKQALRSGDPAAIDTAKTNLANSGKVLSGAVVIPELGRYFPANEQDTLSLQSLSNIQDLIRPPLQTDMALPGQMAIAGGTKTSEAPKTDVVRPTGGGTTTPPGTASPAFPVFELATGKQMLFDTGTNIFSNIVSSKDSYEYHADKLAPGPTVTNHMQASLARAMMNDSGTMDAGKQTALQNTINNFNKKAIEDTPEGREIRKKFVEVLWNTFDRLGMPRTQGASGIVFELEEIRRQVSDLVQRNASPDTINNKVTSLIKQYMGKWFNANAQSGFNTSKMGGTLAQSFATSNNYKGKINISGSSSIQPWEQFDQMYAAAFEAAQLFAAAGLGKTSYENYSNGGRRVVTWLVNPTDSTLGQYAHSIITVPSSVNNPGLANGKIDFNTVEAMQAAQQTVGSSTDPAHAAAVFNVDGILGAVAQPGAGERGLYALIGGQADDMVREAKNELQGRPASGTIPGARNLTGNQLREVSRNEAVSWQGDSDKAIRRNITANILLGNLLGADRARRITNTSTNPFTTPPKFNTNQAK